MRRLHLFEWEDQPWLPTLFRDFITDHLRYMWEFFGTFNPVAFKIMKAMQSIGQERIIDLCSGAGGPVLGLQQYLEEELGFRVQVLLTDLFPNAAASRRIEAEPPSRVSSRLDPTSAFDVPADLEGFRTIFTGFHHFQPNDARRILRDAVAKRAGIGVFEAQERQLALILLGVPLFFLMTLLVNHKVGPLSLGRAIFTYVVPLAPLIAAWDALVSCLRTYSPEELQELVSGLEDGSYAWEIGQIEAVARPWGRYRITYLIGLPRRKGRQA